MGTSELRLSVIIPTHELSDSLFKCLASVTATSPPPDEVILVLDGITNDSNFLAGLGAIVPVVLDKRGGPARARNFGVQRATGHILGFLDSDVVVHPNTFQMIRDIFTSKTDISAVFGSYDDAPTDAGVFSQYKNLLHHFIHQQSNEEASTFWAGCGAIRRDVFLRMGGFNEKYTKPSVEDVELGLRMTEAGHRIVLHKTLIVTHLKRWTLFNVVKTDVICRALPWTKLIASKRKRLKNDLNMTWSSRSSFLILLATLMVWFLSSGPAVILTFFLLGTLVLINRKLYHFFYSKRGFRFMIASIFLHWLYYLYSGFTFLFGTLYFYSLGHISRPRKLASRKDSFDKNFQT